MSNHLAVAAATQTLANLLDAQLTRDFIGAHVNAGRPDGTATVDSDPEVRLFLYRMEPNAAWRNNELPTRSASGQTSERPQIGITLHYLLTFVGNEAQLEPERMLGSVVRTLNAHPLLTRADVEAMVAAAVAEDQTHPLALSDLADQPDIVRVSPLTLTLDELSTLWSSFFETPYRLSVAYEACVVVLTSDETPTRALPVRDRRMFSTTMLGPAIRQATAAAGPLAPIMIGTSVVITGDRLRGTEITVVSFGVIEVVPPSEAVTGARIAVAVPPGVRAGVIGLRVIHRRLMGDPPEPRLAGQSSASPLVIRPELQPLAPDAVHDVLISLESALRSGGVTVSVDPPVGQRQQVTMMLNAVPGGAGRSFVFEDERRDGEGEPDETPDLDVPFSGVPPGDYLIRIAVDGAETALTVDTTPGGPVEGRYAGPVVVVA